MFPPHHARLAGALSFGWVLGWGAACGDKPSESSADSGEDEGAVSSADAGEEDGGDGEDGGGGEDGGSEDGGGDSGSGDGGGDSGSGDGGDPSGVAAVYPSEPTTADTLQCLLDGALAVAAELPVTWTADGIEHPDSSDDDVGAGQTRTGQQWTCTVASDVGVSTSDPVVISSCGGALSLSSGDTLTRAPSRLGTQITVETWLRFDTDSQGTFLTVGRGPYHGLELQYGAALELNYKWGNWNDQWEHWYSGTTFADSDWHHVAVVFEEPDFRVYVDGRWAAGTASPDSLHLDGTYGVTLSPSAALVDELHVTRSVLYDSNFTPPYPLVADSETDVLLHLDEGSGTAAVDSGPDAVDGFTTAARSDESAGCTE